MIGITLTTDQIRNAPKEVRQWIEHEVIASLGLATEAPMPQPVQAAHISACSEAEAAAILAQVRGMLPAVNVFFEFGRPGVVFGEPPVMAFRLIDILHHTKLQNMGQVMTCLEAINDAFIRLRGDPNVRFCGFDNEGHCFVTPETQVSIAALWHEVIASQQAAAGTTPLAQGLAPAA
ncbi:hypothetical protein [Bradyrhizobium sp. ARR65]|uniref:hypothetical protein n=1 Tax=Bradyrhizobium sp. ARR65 TaxID=1040989 RepID=UPI0004677EF4|nr:hypothetical protein [Bradyrhizobium sp. ARR65]